MCFKMAVFFTLNTCAISRSCLSVHLIPSYTFAQVIGSTIKNAVNAGILFLAKKTNSKIINDATGVARIILETGERNASRIRESAVSMPMMQPAMIAARYPMSMRTIDSAMLLQNADVTASEQILPRTLKGEGTIRSLPTAICIISHITIHAAAMHSIFNILYNRVFIIWFLKLCGMHIIVTALS